MKKLTLESFLERSKKIHNNKYDYSKVEYVNAKTKVCIICPKHGEFWQTPDNHLKGKGCAYCAKIKKLTTKEFIKRAKEVHDNKYDYSKVEYVNTHKKVCIICPKHGEFWQTPANHLLGRGCKVCVGNSYSYSTKEWVEKAKEIHNDEYDYSKVEYINSKTKVCIICPKHGEFMMLPNNHLFGQKCPSCRESKLEREVNEILKSKNIIFHKQKRFEWLGKQSLDFYLPEHSLAIECQGIQHYKPVDFGGKGESVANEEFLLTVKRDNKKKKLCEKNGIKILYINNDNLNFIKNEDF